MATIERDVDTTHRNWIALGVLGVAAVVVGVVLYFALRSQPQMGTSAEVFNTVDALYTAVRNEDEKRVADCERRLRAAHEAGKLPTPAWDSLSDVIATARAGRWRPAAEALYEFMRGQRREGVIEGTHEHDKKGKAPKGKAK